MKAHTNSFKENIKLFAREIDCIISYDIDGYTFQLGAEQLNEITPHYEGDILKSVMKQLDIDSNVDIPLNTVIECQFGVKVGEEYEYINFGKYIVLTSEKQEDTKSYRITCYDKMLYSMIDYKSIGITYPITVRDYITALCDYLNLDFANKADEFANYDKVITKELYLDESNNSLGYYFRDVFDELAQVTASTICINEETDKLEIRYIQETNDIIDESYLKDTSVAFGEKIGPINSIVLSRSAGSDNVYLQDEESIELNGLYEIKISDNQIMNFNDRDTYLPDILDKLDGLTYYSNNYNSPGICYYNICDRYGVQVEDKLYVCVMLNDEVHITQGLEEIVVTEKPETSETNYEKADKTDRKINQTYIIVDKQQGQIEALTSTTQSIASEMGNMYTIEQVNTLIQNAETGVTNTFSEAGGNNILKNTGLWFEETGEKRYIYPNDELYPSNNTFGGAISVYEYWQGNVRKNRNDNATNYNSLLLQKGSLIQTQEVPNGTYSISFYYQKLISSATASVIINENEYALDSLDVTQFYTGEQDINGNYITLPIEVNAKRIKIEFKTNIDNSVEVYDLMCNKGNVKLAYSQNYNETITDTVNISKGITITSTNYEAIFKANVDGIRVLTLQGEVKTRFTDKGMSTKEAIIEDKAQVVKVLWQEVEGQTWITRM